MAAKQENAVDKAQEAPKATAEKMVKIVGTGTSVHYPKGETVEVPAADAEYLIAKGKATK